MTFDIIHRNETAIYLRLPVELQTPVCGDGKCDCDYCKKSGKPGMWDTLCVPIAHGRHGRDYAHAVHMPEVKAKVTPCG